MSKEKRNKSRRAFLKLSTFGSGAMLLPGINSGTKKQLFKDKEDRGGQRLTVSQLQNWEALGYGMFIHFGMSTYDGDELSRGIALPTLYRPDRLDVDQWVSVAKEAGMKYIVLTTKHVSGFCLWPTKHTEYNIMNSNYKIDVVHEFVQACKNYGIKPGFYYCSWDNHNKFGSETPTDIKWSPTMNSFPKNNEDKAPFTSSMYQTFQTAQIRELISNYGPVMEMWIDIPGVLGSGYRTYLYDEIARMTPDAYIMMNNGFGNGEKYDSDYAWPADLMAMERTTPSPEGFKKWRIVNGEEYYLPGEVCDTIGKNWFYVEGDAPRPEKELVEQYLTVRKRGANFLLDVPPDKHGVIPDKYVDALLKLKKNAGIV